MLSDSPPTVKTECHTLIAILCTIFVCLGAFVLIFALLYLAYFKPLADAHKHCLRQQQNEREKQQSIENTLEQYDTQNKFAYPKYIYNMQVLPEERCRPSYVKNREYRRRKKKARPISLATINENYAINSFPKSTIIDDQWTVRNEIHPHTEGSRKNCKCRNCIIGQIANTTSPVRPSFKSRHSESYKTYERLHAQLQKQAQEERNYMNIDCSDHISGKNISEINNILKIVIDKEDCDDAIKLFAKHGTTMRRVKRGKIGQAKLIFLSNGNKYLQYYTSGYSRIIPPRQKREVRIGFGTDRLQKAAKRILFQQFASEENCISVIVRQHGKIKRKTIDFVAASSKDKEIFVHALQYIIDKKDAKMLDFNEKQWIIDKFHEADVNQTDKINFDKVWRLLDEMNLGIDENYAKALFQNAGAKKYNSGWKQIAYLDQEGFLRFFMLLTVHFEEGKIMRKYSSQNDETLSANDLKNFLIYEQQFENIDNDTATSIMNEIISKQGNYRMEKKINLLGPFGFRALLRSRWGNILRSEHENIFQNMDHPLSHYYINSSHNTYLIGTQVKGDATVEGYINAIKKGARLLELDVLDGVYGEPCIGHHGTLVTPIRLKDALVAIKNYAFKYTPFPLILTIENRCSLQQQQVMARNFIEVFGNNIYLVPKNESLQQLPSPNQLKYKYLLRSKIRLFTNKQYANGKHDNNTATTSPTAATAYDDGDDDDDDEIAKSTLFIDSEFSKLISLFQTKLSHNLYDDIKKHSVNSSVSISETQIKKLMEISESFTTYTSTHLVKSYPKGLRQNSSNFCPIQSWIFGIQSVALNMQTNGKDMDLNSGLFRINGNCGYVLKPPILIHGLNLSRVADTIRMIMTLSVISGEYLPKPFSKDGEIIDPYVIVEVLGIPADCNKFQTKVINNNGFYPVWNDIFKFELRSPEMAMLRLCVKDYDTVSRDDFIGEFSIPISSIRPGYSIVNLYTGYDRILNSSAAILIHIDFQQIHF
ncbi:1-phosphatidylinositol 4,5-bisphosphate phosphodiesterase delta-4 [Dirofilaria immitis]